MQENEERMQTVFIVIMGEIESIEAFPDEEKAKAGLISLMYDYLTDCVLEERLLKKEDSPDSARHWARLYSECESEEEKYETLIDFGVYEGMTHIGILEVPYWPEGVE